MQESNKDGKPELGKNDIDVAKEHFKIRKHCHSISDASMCRKI